MNLYIIKNILKLKKDVAQKEAFNVLPVILFNSVYRKDGN